MKLTRKQFLSRVTTGLVGTALGSSILKAAVPKRPLAAAGFENQVGTSFQIRADGRDLTKLVLNRFENKPSSKGTTQFSLQFAAPAGASLEEGSYDVKHAALGNFRMFIIPMGSGGQDGNSYRADFNLLA